MQNFPYGEQAAEYSFDESVSDELFIGFGKGIQKNIVDQYWFTKGLGYGVSDEVQIYIGYLLQYILKGDGTHAERNHTLRVSAKIKFDWNREMLHL